jgi:hypothetical protein
MPSGSSTAPERSGSAFTAVHRGGRGGRVLLHEPQVELDEAGEGHERERVAVGAGVIQCDGEAESAQRVDARGHLGRAVGQRAFGS